MAWYDIMYSRVRLESILTRGVVKFVLDKHDLSTFVFVFCPLLFEQHFERKLLVTAFGTSQLLRAKAVGNGYGFWHIPIILDPFHG